MQKLFLCAPISAIFYSSTFKSFENLRVDLIIGSTIRSTRYFQNTKNNKKSSTRHGHERNCRSIFPPTNKLHLTSQGTTRTHFWRAFRICHCFRRQIKSSPWNSSPKDRAKKSCIRAPNLHHQNQSFVTTTSSIAPQADTIFSPIVLATSWCHQ